jgi:hypothetical protein
MTASKRGSQRLAQQTTELAMAVPQVVSHRVYRMMTAGLQPDAKDQREFHRMGAEKIAAFQESWMAMGTHLFSVQQAWMLSWMRAVWMPWPSANPWSSWQRSSQQLRTQLHRATVDTAAQGLAPVHKRAVANAKRLARFKKT